MMGGNSSPRNPPLTRILANLGRIDRAGSGLNVVWRTWRERLGQVPAIEQSYQPLEVRITVPLPTGADRVDVGNETYGVGNPDPNDPNPDPNDPNPDPNDPNPDPLGASADELTKRGRAILLLLVSNPSASYQVLADELSVSVASVKRDLAALKSAGLIVREGGTRGVGS